MREILEFNIDSILPDIPTVLRRQGVPRSVTPDERILILAEKALNLFVELSAPYGVTKEVSLETFADIYYGDGLNETDTPVGEIYKRAENLALFAITVGDDVSLTIGNLFEEHDFALASMLDAVASEATELAGVVTEGDYLNNLLKKRVTLAESQILRYSPGYCGWHISGQRKLFEALNPEEIGMTLTDSFLMQPMKSISGVMIVGPAKIHNFAISYKFCDNCETKDCRDRIKQVFDNVRIGNKI